MDLIVEATLAGTIIGGLTAAGNVWGTISQRLVDRRRVTLDILREIEADPDIILARRKVLELVKAGNLARFAEDDLRGSDEFYAIVTVLNHFELISIGVQHGVIDPNLFKKINKGSVLMYWKNAASFVHALRAKQSNDNIYKELEGMTVWLEDKEPPPRPKLRHLFY